MVLKTPIILDEGPQIFSFPALEMLKKNGLFGGYYFGGNASRVPNNKMLRLVKL